MKAKGLDGREYVWNLAMYKNNARANCSSLHLKARAILSELYPFDVILEEVPLPGSALYADFYIHSQKLMIEVNGEQHYESNAFFHKTKMAFHKGQHRDRKKLQWCQINDIVLVTLPYNEEEYEWRERIKNAYS